MSKPTVLVAVPQPLRGRILTAETTARLQALADVRWNEEGRDWSAPELAAQLPGQDALVTGWGIVPLTEAALAHADRLKIVAHSAGSVKGFATEAVYRRGIVVTHAAARIADSVAEFALMMAMVGLRQPQLFDAQLKAGESWPQNPAVALHEMAGQRVGILGLGYVGTRAAQLFQAVGAKVWAYDPYCSSERAAALQVHLAPLAEVLSGCQVISIHLPVTDETRHLLGAKELALIADGAVVVNSARSLVVDSDALLCELSTGRFWAALDVFDEEPLPVEHLLRRLPNVFLTPHIAGRTLESYTHLMAVVVDELERFFSGQPLRFAVSHERLATMA